MDMKVVEEALRRTMDDARLSRGESRALKELLKESGPSESEVASIRALIFRLAREAMQRHEDRSLLDWAEASTRALRAAVAAPTERRLAEAHFFPNERSLRRIVGLIDGCRRSLDVCVFTITHNELSAALVRAHKRKVAVRVISDDEKASDTGSVLVHLARAGIPVRFDATSDHMHNKFALFDDRILLTGSFNWTRSAVRSNQENVVVTDDPVLVGRFGDEFAKLWKAFSG